MYMTDFVGSRHILDWKAQVFMIPNYTVLPCISMILVLNMKAINLLIKISLKVLKNMHPIREYHKDNPINSVIQYY